MSLGGTTVTSITSGTMFRTTCVFTDLLTGQPASPDTVIAGYQLGDSDPVSTTYPTAIASDEAGVFYWDIDTTDFAAPQGIVLMVLYWQGSGDVDAVSDPVVVRIVGPAFLLG